MIIVKIMGGLGNQLFQYAFAYELLNAGVKLKLDLGFYEDKNNGATPRESFYSIYGLNLPLANEKELEKAYDTSRKIFCRIRRRLKTFLHFRIGSPVYTDNEIKDKQSIVQVKSYAVYAGYWHNPIFFSTTKEKIIDIWKGIIPKLDKRDTDLINMFNCDTVSVHVRGTDYLNKSNYDGLGSVCDSRYYIEAMKRIEEKIKDPFYVVFSDDFVYAKELLDLSERKYIMIDWHGENDTLKDFYLMRLCRHHIMANSSFGWWAVHLCEFAEGITCCPSSWRGNVDSTELLEKDWIKI